MEYRLCADHTGAKDFIEELERIESEDKKVTVAWAYAEDLYRLRVHLQYLRDSESSP